MPWHYHLEYPWMLVLLAAVPAYLAWYFLRYDKRRLHVRLSYDPHLLHKPKRNWAWLRYLPMGLQILAFAVLVIALARPQTNRTARVVQSEGIDIMLAIDCSDSMRESDFKPNRLEVAKDVASNFIRGRQNDRIGIVIFAERAFSYAPLTVDYTLLQQLIDELSFTTMPNNGTAIGDAIAVAINRLKPSDAPSKVVILLSDGTNTAGVMDPGAAARLAKKNGIRLYSVGVGKDKLEFDEERMRLKEVTPLDVQLMKEMAIATGGAYFRSTDAESLRSIFAEISALERAPIKQRTLKESYDHYPWLIGLAILMLAGAFGLIYAGITNLLEE